MTSAALSLSRPAPRARHVPACALALLPVLLLALAIAAINPIGFIGGGSDDWQYLDAARCIVAQGGCLPATHWAARWPLVLPTAATIALFGESREAIMLVPLAFGLSGIALFVVTMARGFGAQAAAIGGIALVASPMVGGELTALAIAAPEFCFIMAAIACLTRGSPRATALAGVLFALAVMTRATALACLPILALAAAWRGEWRRAVPFLAGFAAPLAIEAAGYWLATGDAGHGWRLALGHGQLATSELSAGVDTTRSPLLNPEFIAGWSRAMGIEVHWTIDPVLNLLADPRGGPTLIVALALILLHRRGIGRAPLLLLGAGALYFGALTYGLAVDPKPRMFVPVIAAGAAIIGVLGARGWRERARVPIMMLLVLLIAITAAVAHERFAMARIERVADTWARAGPDALAFDATAQRALTLSPAVRASPSPDAASLLAVIAQGPCATAIAPDGRRWPLVAERRFGPDDGIVGASLRGWGVLPPPPTPSLCAFSRPRDRAASPRS